jgi:hypothetical protein
MTLARTWFGHGYGHGYQAQTSECRKCCDEIVTTNCRLFTDGHLLLTPIKGGL